MSDIVYPVCVKFEKRKIPHRFYVFIYNSKCNLNNFLNYISSNLDLTVDSLVVESKWPDPNDGPYLPGGVESHNHIRTDNDLVTLQLKMLSL